MKFLKILLLSAVISSSLICPSYSSSEKNNEIVIEDNVNSDAKAGSVKMTFVVNEEPEKIWSLLIDYDKWPQFMDDVEKIIIRENKKDSAIVFVKAKAPLGMDIHYVLKRIYNKKDYEITWKMLEGTAKDVQGSWNIFPISSKRCRVVYTNYVDVGFNVPPKVVSLLLKKKLPVLAENIKNYLRTYK